MVENVTRLLSPRLLILELGQQTRRELEITWLGPMKRSLSREPCLTLAKDFRACREPDTGSVCSKRRRGGGAIWLELAAIALAMGIGISVLALEVEL